MFPTSQRLLTYCVTGLTIYLNTQHKYIDSLSGKHEHDTLY